MREFSLDFSLNQKPLFFQIYSYFKQGILEGHLHYGTFLPSIRSCAQSLKVSKNTVESAYQLLVSEGFIHNIPKKGYEIVFKVETTENKTSPDPSEDIIKKVDIDFRYGNIELSAFPFNQWNKARNVIIGDHQSNYEVEGDSQGEYPLRKELSRLLFESRGVISTPEQIIIGSTPQQLVSLLCQFIDRNENQIGVEDPGYDGARNTFINHNFHVHAIPLESDGVSIEALEKSSANIIYVSPSQQFLHKMAMPQDKRQKLVQWVNANHYVIEDDYEWEFKYEEGALASIQSHAPQKVIYIGRISKALLPVTNISYVVLPYEMLSVFHTKITEYDQPVTRLDQLTFAQYLSNGYWYKHLQKMRKHYEEKRITFFEAISERKAYFVEVEGKDMGLHAFVTVKTNQNESELIKLGLRSGVKVYGTSRYRSRTTSDYPTVLLGYGALSCKEIHQGIRLLTEAWFESL
ncbi:MocR-like pyridoxine biosynthesis transcription factor PdxR [Paenibacillus sp. KN14-4R]|uniref:MocR-like pyridoxine biosynthesis transcription factor PdxR n=1 Tax=Paenibacillus sp. KN14-4R TaxID=3445773 RepID=UPI003F9F09FA